MPVLNSEKSQSSSMGILQGKRFKKKLFSWSRALHIYISTFLFGLLVFFCITGVTLNHRWYGGDGESSSLEIKLTDEQITQWGLQLSEEWKPNLNKINAYFSKEYGFSLPSSIDIDEEYFELMLDFKVPAGFSTVIISAEERTISLEMETGTVLGIVNDLHKGRHSGSVWFWLIDVSAVLMCVFAVTGMIILFQGKKYRRSGLFLVSAGLLTPLLIYFVFVPRLSFI